MEITPPFGYREIVPLHKSSGVMLPAPGFLPEFIATTNAMPVSYTEFGVACRDFPIVFTSNDQGKSYAAVAVLGLAQNENLFVRGGAWEANTYVPAYVRRYPFCMARVTMNNSEQQNRLICIEKGFIADDGEKLFDAEGKPVEKWAPIERLLREYEADLDRTREMCAIIADYALLEPFTMQATPTRRAAAQPRRHVPRQGREARAPQRRPAQEPLQEGDRGPDLRPPPLARELRAAAVAQGEAGRPARRDAARRGVNR